MSTAFLNVLLALNLSLLFMHEMDAIKAKEWRLFVFLKDLEDELAYKIFTIIHLPLYFVLLYSIIERSTTAYIVLDVFLIGHTVAHALFERYHPRYEFKNRLSRAIIYPMGVVAIIHLVGLL